MIPSLQYLRHGKALCGKVFKRFVETFNYHNDFVANLKGDGDLPCDDGVINVDRTDPTHPVIRLNKNNLAIPAGGGGKRLPQCFDIENMVIEGEGTPVSATFDLVRPYFMIGGKVYDCPRETVQLPTPGIIYLAIDLSSDNPTANVNTCGDINSLPRDGDRLYAIPLYEFDENGSVVCDFRTIPSAASWEMLS